MKRRQSVFEAADHLRTEFARLEAQLADPEVHTDLTKARKSGRRYAQLAPLIQALDEHARLTGDLAAARELAAEDQGFAAEADELSERLKVLTSGFTKCFRRRVRK